MRRLALALAYLWFAGAALADEYQLTDEERAAMEAGVKELLSDPGSAVFGIVRAGRWGQGPIRVCGVVNAKNRFGGYAGDQLFTGEFYRATNGGKVFIAVIRDSETAVETGLEWCRRFEVIAR